MVLYLLHTKYLNIHSTSKMTSFWGIDIVTSKASLKFKGVLCKINHFLKEVIIKITM